MTSGGSHRSYSDRTLKILWGRAAGRCAVPNCRIELLVDATDHDPIVVIGDIAHIEAASDSGPRANLARAARERDEYDNLILLCKNCHARLDGQKATNRVDVIRDLRARHEAWVRASLPERGASATGWQTLVLQGEQPIDVGRALEALSPDFAAGDPAVYSAAPNTAEWSQIERDLREWVAKALDQGDPFDRRYAIFPLAPVSACAALGWLLTNRPRVKLFQYHRDQQSWAWPGKQGAAEVSILGLPDQPDNRVGRVAFCFNFSALVRDEFLEELHRGYLCRVDISTAGPSTSWLVQQEQLVALAQSTRRAFEAAAARFPACEGWDLFLAVPAPGAVVIGQQLNPTMIPPVQLFEFRGDRRPAYRASVELKDA